MKGYIKRFLHRYFRKHSLQGLYVRFIIIFILLPLIIISTFSFYFSRTFIQSTYAGQYRDSIQNEIENQFLGELKHVYLVIQNLLTYNDLYVRLLDSESDPEANKAVVEKELSAFLNNVETISGVELYTVNGQRYRYFKTEITALANPEELIQDSIPSVMYISENCATDGENRYLIIGGHMYNYYSSYSLGNFVVYINQNRLQPFYQSLYSSGHEAFLTINGKIISHMDPSMIGSRYYMPQQIQNNVNTGQGLTDGYTIDNRQIHLPYVDSPICLQTILSYRSIFTEIVRANLSLYLIVILIFLLSLFLAILLSNRLSRNIRKLQKNVLDVEAYLDEQTVYMTAIPPKNELFLLEMSFEEMRQRVNSLLETNSEILNNLRIAELNALQAQINPHFLYNALAAVSWTAKLHNQPEIAKLVSALSSYFRIGLHGGAMYIPIREEIKHVQSYIYVEQTRFPGLFDVEYTIDEDILDCHIPKIVLQPLVENAIKHGFKKKQADGHLVIKGFCDGNNDIILQVIDNGSGADQNPLNFLQEEDSSHYGLKNVQERLKITFGEAYGLSFESIPNVQTCVTIKIKKQ